MTGDVLTKRALNRATLARQHLLARTDGDALATVEHLAGLQAQVPLNPYLALWSRLTKFDPDALGRLLIDRRLVRLVVMRGTIHLISVDDAVMIRPLCQPVLDGELTRHSEHAPHLRDVDLEPVLAFARRVLAQQPLTGTKLRAALAAEFPDLDAPAMAYACRNHLALVQVPPRGVWGKSGAVTSTTIETWTGRSLDPSPSIDTVVVRYLAAFGPATVADVSTWSRFTGLREVVERLRPQVRVFHDERGRELFDLPDAPRPDPETPAAPRFLPEYDNVLLSHADRSRFTPDEPRAHVAAGEHPVHGTVLIDGAVSATWRIETDDDGARLAIDHAGRIPARTGERVAAEGRRMLRFLHPAATTGDVRFVSHP